MTGKRDTGRITAHTVKPRSAVMVAAPRGMANRMICHTEKESTMGEPKDAEYERHIRREIHKRYKVKAAETASLYKRLMEAQAKIRMLELLLDDQKELVELADVIISDGTPEDHDSTHSH